MQLPSYHKNQILRNKHEKKKKKVPLKLFTLAIFTIHRKLAVALSH